MLSALINAKAPPINSRRVGDVKVDLLLPRTFSTQVQELSRKQSRVARAPTPTNTASLWALYTPRGRGRPRHTFKRRTMSFMPIPPEIKGQKYISLASFRKNGNPVYTPIWFGEKDDKLYVMTRSDSGKYKRIRNNPKVGIAPCTMRGKIT